MITGCAPFFLLGLIGVAVGSWFFGSHIAARLTGLVFLALFVFYFALLNWTARRNLEIRNKNSEDKSPPPPSDLIRTGYPGESLSDQEAQAEWGNYLRIEGRILWLTVTALIGVIIYMAGFK